ncbi:MAG: hypothetical protein AVDCRST_MAG89-1669 [uncultured Gemmatimonadetes bacterium]|uniref:Uncharacterized protein n=1 Tax=uncultured Gemmatimonadota bacterium TaxID=203437 RepID=A0A6J4L1W6_9BACT|nr:MAG: hypothetical protein AVDCRST_MAG89-1669 [uncultured Gemmatimonadota bacterium]
MSENRRGGTKAASSSAALGRAGIWSSRVERRSTRTWFDGPVSRPVTYRLAGGGANTLDAPGPGAYHLT